MYQAKCQNTKTFSFPILEISRKAIAICQINLDLPIVIDNIINIFWQVDNMVLISDELEITIVRVNKCTFVIESERMSSKDSVKKSFELQSGPTVHSMTQLLVHTFARFTGPSLRLKANNQPKLDYSYTCMTFKVNFLCQKLFKSFFFFFFFCYWYFLTTSIFKALFSKMMVIFWPNLDKCTNDLKCFWGRLLALSLKEDPVQCAKESAKSWVILTIHDFIYEYWRKIGITRYWKFDISMSQNVKQHWIWTKHWRN